MFNVETPAIRVDDQARLGPVSMMLVYPAVAIAEKPGLAEEIYDLAVAPEVDRRVSKLETTLRSARAVIDEQARVIDDLQERLDLALAPKPTWKARVVTVLNSDIRDIIRWLLR